MKILLCCWTWQDTYQQLFELAVTGLAGAQAEVAGAQAEVASARASVDFAEKHWRNATEKEDSVVASTWEQKVKEAKQEVKEAEHKVEKAKQEVVEAEQKVEKAKQEVVEAKQEVVKAKQVQGGGGEGPGLESGRLGFGGTKDFGGPRFLPVLAYPAILSSLPT